MKYEKERVNELFLQASKLAWEVKKLFDKIYNLKQETDKEDDENKGKGG